jgi:hypothetical protein
MHPKPGRRVWTGTAGSFAGEVRALLARRSATGMFGDWPGDTKVVMAGKPR